MTTEWHDSDAEGFSSLFGAYALHALPDEDARAVDEYLIAHPESVREVGTLEEAVAMLPYHIEPVAPNTQLRTRIMAQIYADVANAPEQAPTPTSLDTERAKRRTRGDVATRVWPMIAAVFLLCAVGFGGWAASLQSDLHTKEQQLAASGVTKPVLAALPNSGAQGQVTLLSAKQSAVLTISGLPALATGKVYQVWFIEGSTPTGAGLFSPNTDGSWSGLVRGDVTNAQAIAVSVEPAGGSAAPTGDIIAKGTL